MHLWPTMKVRDSFKVSYLQNYERNVRRMKLAKQSSKKQSLLEKGGGDVEAADHAQGSIPPSTVAVWGRDLFMVLSCGLCCFEGKASLSLSLSLRGGMIVSS